MNPEHLRRKPGRGSVVTTPPVASAKWADMEDEEQLEAWPKAATTVEQLPRVQCWKEGPPAEHKKQIDDEVDNTGPPMEVREGWQVATSKSRRRKK